MRAELPYLGAGIVSLVGGYRSEGRWPDYGTRAVVATVVLVIVAAAANGTKVAPLARAVGMLMLLGAVYGATRQYMKRPPANPGKGSVK